MFLPPVTVRFAFSFSMHSQPQRWLNPPLGQSGLSLCHLRALRPAFPGCSSSAPSRAPSQRGPAPEITWSDRSSAHGTALRSQAKTPAMGSSQASGSAAELASTCRLGASGKAPRCRARSHTSQGPVTSSRSNRGRWWTPLGDCPPTVVPADSCSAFCHSLILSAPLWPVPNFRFVVCPPFDYLHPGF